MSDLSRIRPRPSLPQAGSGSDLALRPASRVGSYLAALPARRGVAGDIAAGLAAFSPALQRRLEEQERADAEAGALAGAAEAQRSTADPTVSITGTPARPPEGAPLAYGEAFRAAWS